MMGSLAKEGTNKVPVDQTSGIPSCCEQRSHQESFETQAPEQFEGL